ncbi:hypothetical protein AMTR_s00017p00100000 [Amborella trichopoda]|uniref:Uncharacterized protein n=1 Tax=Amborella trichopoda TaxID=13333 RepID=W1PLK4_AMBTC|nr:hypothetical protein AMTR_s00017p00100000 [Amborella trichopoda]
MPKLWVRVPSMVAYPVQIGPAPVSPILRVNLIGVIMVIFGLYCVLWAKEKDGIVKKKHAKGLLEGEKEIQGFLEGSKKENVSLQEEEE